MIAHKSLVIDLTKCQWAIFYWKSKSGYTARNKPCSPTVHGASFQETDRHWVDNCTMLEYAIKNKLIDIWYPVCTFQLSANHTVTYTQDKAITMYDAWKAKIFSKSLSKKK